MAYVSPRMSLKIWTSTTDPYDHEQLANNFLKLDNHDHTEGRGTRIPGAGIELGAITSAHIYPGSIVGASLADASITGDKLHPDLLGTTGLQFLWGIVASLGSLTSGAGFSSARTAEGQYTLTFTTPFTSPPSVVISIYSAYSGFHADVTNINTTSCNISIYYWDLNLQTTYSSDANFSVQIIGAT